MRPAELTRWRAEKHFARAVDAYSAALERCPSAILFANRAFAHISLENYGSALADAEASVALDPSYTKARAAAGPPARRALTSSGTHRLTTDVPLHAFCWADTRRL